ncbi:MAG: transglycosylase SLT domain-containing protein [Anaerolineae bacterium]
MTEPETTAPKRKRSASTAAKSTASKSATTKSTAAKSAPKPRTKSSNASIESAVKRAKSTPAKRKVAAAPPVSGRPLWQQLFLTFVRIIRRLLMTFYWLVYQIALRFWLLSVRGKAAVGLALLLIGILLYAITRPPPSRIAAFFMPSVQYWASNITRWSEEYDVDPNLIATLMQIESCGLPAAESYAGAQGLFQVMPFHFSEDEKARMTDPEINAKRGMGVIKDCLERADYDFGLAMVCYNGGPGQLIRTQDQWPNETQRYYVWGSGIFGEAKSGAKESQTLQAWLQAGGASLCRQAEATLRIAAPTTIPSGYTPPASLPEQLPTFDGS